MKQDACTLRLQRLKEITAKIATGISEDSQHKVSYKRITLWVEMNIGLREEKAREYIDKILEVKGWVREGDYIGLPL